MEKKLTPQEKEELKLYQRKEEAGTLTESERIRYRELLDKLFDEMLMIW